MSNFFLSAAGHKPYQNGRKGKTMAITITHQKNDRPLPVRFFIFSFCLFLA